MSPEQYEERAQLVREYAILEFFEFKHLPEHLREVSRPFCDLAFEMARTLPKSAETSAGLRKLLEAKDCAVRARVAKPQEQRPPKPSHNMVINIDPPTILGTPEGVRQMVKMFERAPKPSQGIVINIDPTSVHTTEDALLLLEQLEAAMRPILALLGVHPVKPKADVSAPVSHLVNDDGTVGD